MKISTLFAVTFLLGFSVMAKPVETGAVPGEWTMDFDAARKVAAEKKLPLFLNFTGSDWCMWCKHMEKEVFSKPEWQDYAKNSLMLVWIDFPQDKSLVPEKYQKRNQQLAELFQVQGYPSYIILDDNGKDQLGELQAEQQINPGMFINKLKPILIDRLESIDKLVASMPAAQGAELRKTLEERNATRTELNTVQDKAKQLGAKLSTLDQKVKDLRTKALVDKLPPEQASKYSTAEKELAAAEKELQDWIATKPARNDETRKKYEEMNGKVSALQNRMTELLYGQ